MFKEVSTQVKFPDLEQSVLEFWKAHDIFKKSIQKDAPNGDYIFYEGPPTANGKPGVHHVIARSFKDLFPRYKTMQGFRSLRKGGWDTHGLPVELEIEKKLGFAGKRDIEKFGIAEFNKLAKASAFEYIQEWNQMTERIGFWVDLAQPYITYENSYIESCWWVMKSLWDRNLLFEDYKVTMHCPRCNTSLADHEVSQGFKDDVDDPSVYPKFPANMEVLNAKGLTDDLRQVYIMAWTTTPWTLPANVALAVSSEAEYGLIEAPRAHGDQEQGSEEHDLYIIATALVENVFGEGNYKVLKTFTGEQLVGVPYSPILQGRVPAGEDVAKGFRVITDESVSLGDGTGIIHIAPAYGDLEIGNKNDLPTLFSVDLSGEVYPEVRTLESSENPGPYTGQFFKKADKHIAKDLKERGLLYREARIKHAYPFCWRCGTALLYYAKSSWYLRTSALKDKLLSNNQNINWYPEHIKTGRFGKWLEGNVDWALSRERYWGAPLPIWISEDGQEQICVGSVKELEQLTGQDLSALELHRPYVDDITFTKNNKTFKRVPYTVDVWFESGAMPYAQWHYPFENKNELPQNFPADYICEAIDQTRGWFYSLHALSTLLTDSGDGEREAGVLAHIAADTSSFKNVICLGHILDEKGEKMSKSKGNIVNPWDVLNAQGADALRWYLYSSAPPGNSKRFSQNLVDEALRDFFLTLWNTYSFFVLYANLDKPDLAKDVPVKDRPEIDRWLVAKINALVRDVTNMLDNYDPTSATRTIRDFVVDELSNWYVRRNRRRFWKSESDTDKLAAYKTLYEALITVTKLIAPMAPFVSESLYQNLVLTLDKNAPESVHLESWPQYDASLIDESLLRDMNALLRVVELGRSARNGSGMKIRQPLPEVLVRVRTSDELAGLKRLEEQLEEELNVKKVSYLDVTADFVTYTVRPNLPLVGKRIGKNIPALKQFFANNNGKDIARNVREGKTTEILLNGESYNFEPEAFLLDAQSPEGYSAVEDKGYLAALNTTLTPELIQEGFMRDVVRLVQNARKSAGLEVSDTIHLGIETSSDVLEAVKAHQSTIGNEVLAKNISLVNLPDASYSETAEVEGTPVSISLKKAI
ncbi:MAG: isoleucine--tRNA ligase [Trueperaceae bacterium]